MNEKKLSYLWKVCISLTISVVVAGFCLLPVTFATNEKATKVEIINPAFYEGGEIMADTEKVKPPEEPTPPPLRQIKESFEKDNKETTKKDSNK